MAKQQIFLSYSRADRLAVDRLYGDLSKKRGFALWMDVTETGIVPGVDWQTELKKQISASAAMIVCVSPDSIRSAPCQEEIAQAVKENKKLYPVLMRRLDAGQTIADSGVGNIQFVDLTANYEAGVKSLARQLPHPTSYYLVRVGALVAVLLVLAVAYLLLRPPPVPQGPNFKPQKVAGDLNITAMTLDSHGKVYFSATDAAGASHLYTLESSTSTYQSIADLSAPADNIALAENCGGAPIRVWMSLHGTGISVYPDNQLFTPTTAKWLPPDKINMRALATYCDSQQQSHVYLAREGIKTLLVKADGTIELSVGDYVSIKVPCDPSDGTLCDPTAFGDIRALLVKEGVLWVAYVYGKVFEIPLDEVSTPHTYTFDGQSITSLASDDTSILLGAASGILRPDGSVFAPINDGFTSLELVMGGNFLWGGNRCSQESTCTHLIAWDKNGVPFPEELVGRDVNDLAVDANGGLWIATSAGLIYDSGE